MILVCRSMEEAVDFANELAPEHLEVCCANPMEYIGRWITPARCSWAITARNPWEIITRVRTRAAYLRHRKVLFSLICGQLHQEV